MKEEGEATTNTTKTTTNTTELTNSQPILALSVVAWKFVVVVVVAATLTGSLEL